MSNDRDTPAAGLPIWAPMATVDRWHTEDSVWKKVHTEEHRELDLQMRDQENWNKNTERRLGEGAKKMTIQEASLNKILRPSLINTLVIFACCVGTIVSVTWMLAKYPGPNDFGGLRDKVIQIQMQQIEQKGSINAVKSAVDQLNMTLNPSYPGRQ